MLILCFTLLSISLNDAQQLVIGNSTKNLNGILYFSIKWIDEQKGFHFDQKNLYLDI
jgi:hypothetical protein